LELLGSFTVESLKGKYNGQNPVKPVSKNVTAKIPRTIAAILLIWLVK
jgi:hypothetical protein